MHAFQRRKKGAKPRAKRNVNTGILVRNIPLTK